MWRSRLLRVTRRFHSQNLSFDYCPALRAESLDLEFATAREEPRVFICLLGSEHDFRSTVHRQHATRTSIKRSQTAKLRRLTREERLNTTQRRPRRESATPPIPTSRTQQADRNIQSGRVTSKETQISRQRRWPTNTLPRSQLATYVRCRRHSHHTPQAPWMRAHHG